MPQSESKRYAVYKTQAELEFADAVERYESTQHGLGERFQTAVLKCVASACEFPDNADRLVHDLRARYVKKFPYRVIDKVEDERIVIFAVAHHSRDHDYWQDRID